MNRKRTCLLQAGPRVHRAPAGQVPAGRWDREGEGILDEVVAVTGCHRKSAVRPLSGRRRVGRPVEYLSSMSRSRTLASTTAATTSAPSANAGVVSASAASWRQRLPRRRLAYVPPAGRRASALRVPHVIRNAEEVPRVTYYRLDRVPVAARRVQDPDVRSTRAPLRSIDFHLDEPRVDILYPADGLRVLIDYSPGLAGSRPLFAGHPVRLRTVDRLLESVAGVVGVRFYHHGDHKRPKYQRRYDP